MHVDPDVAACNGFARPILRGLCTLGIAARAAAAGAGHHPDDLCELEARLAAPVLPGDTVDVHVGRAGANPSIEARVGGQP